MKSNYVHSRAEARRIAREAAAEETTRMYDKAYREAVNDVVAQNTAIHLYALVMTFGFGEKRLKRFLEESDRICDLMIEGKVPFGRGFTPDDIIKHMEEKYHLDLTLKEVVIRDRKREK